MDDKQRAEAARDQMQQELNHGEMGIWWLSYADPSAPTGQQFLGVIIVRAPGFITAVRKCGMLGISPGGQVAGIQLVDPDIPEFNMHRLLSKQELLDLGYAAEEHDQHPSPQSLQ